MIAGLDPSRDWRWRPAIQTGLGRSRSAVMAAPASGPRRITDALYAAVAIVVFFLC